MAKPFLHKGRERVHIPRSFWSSITLSSLYVVLLIILLILSQLFHLFPGEPLKATMPMSLLLSFGLSWIGFKVSGWKYKHGTEHRSVYHKFRTWVPLIFTLALACQLIGASMYAYNGVHHITTFPSTADAVTLITYPLLIVGMMCFPMQSLSGKTRFSALLNSALIIIALITFSWYFLLGPLLLNNGSDNFLVLITHLAFPSFDLLLMSYLVLFIITSPRGPLRPAVIMLTLALFLFTMTDSIFQYQHLHSIDFAAWYLIGWALGNAMIALAIQSMRWLPSSLPVENAIPASSSVTTTSVWQTLLPYTLVPAVFGLALYIWGIDRSSPLAIGTYSCSLLLLVLIFVKQVVAIREIHRLNNTLQQVNGRLEALATTDPLTELPNHRALMTSLTYELDRAQRYERSCSLLFFDLDHFKALNDGYGHAAGDEVLSIFGQRLHESVRGIDIVGRWGGEEFVAILPETTMQEASEIAERIRVTVSQQPFAIGGGLFLTCSIGVASYPTHATVLNDLVNAADQAMYAAKRLGRNQLRCIDDPAVQLVLSSEEQTGDREEVAMNGMMEALISLMQQRDVCLKEHAGMVADLVKQVAIYLGVADQEAHMMQLAGELHDIGKIGISDAILQKPDRLNAEEWQQMKKHPEMGAEIVTHIPTLRPLGPVILAHHERWDGTGYPRQLSGSDIPLAARIISVVDAYSAMIMDRPYQRARPSEEALQELRCCSSTQFDPNVVEALAITLKEQAFTKKISVTAA